MTSAFLGAVSLCPRPASVTPVSPLPKDIINLSKIGLVNGAPFRLVPIYFSPDLRSFSEKIAKDPYAAYRHKQIARVMVKNEKDKKARLIRQPHEPLYQGAEVIKTNYSGLTRDYPAIPDAVLDLIEPAINAFAKAFNLYGDRNILVQFQRVVAPGIAAIEGVHRDGIAALGIICVERVGLTAESAVTTIYELNEKNVRFNGTLEEGQGVFLWDPTSKHVTDGLKLRPDVDKGWRTVILLSYPASSPEDYVVPTGTEMFSIAQV